jgi:P-type Ca2+ transporter type 2C
MAANDGTGRIRPAEAAQLHTALKTVLGRRGSLRDLFVALADLAPNQFSGHVFRESLANFNLVEAFAEAIQEPRLLHSIDAVWCVLDADSRIVEFHFTGPQTFQRQVGMGQLTFEFARVLAFQVEADGDVSLRRGDIILRWLLLSEPLLLQLRHSPANQADLLILSAGNVFSRRTQLQSLTLPTQFAGPAPETLDVEEPLPAPSTVLVLVRAVGGRVRLQVRGLYRNPRLKQQLEQGLVVQPGIYRVSASTITGTLLVTHDASLTFKELVTWINRLIHGREVRVGPVADKPWHMLDGSTVVDYWDGDSEQGLPGWVIPDLQARYGRNALPDPQTHTRWSIFVEQFKSLPVALLGFSAALSLVTGGLADGVVILSVVLINATLGYLTENWAEQTIAGLSQTGDLHALAWRDGHLVPTLADELVPGDIIILKRGMVVPADARLLTVDDLTIDESTLTGESLPISKDAGVLVEVNIPLANRHNMVYRGTIVSGGSGRAVVVSTGPLTEIGKIQRLLAQATRPETPLQRQLRLLGGQLVFVTLAACGGVFFIGLLRGRGFLPMFKVAISLAVAAVPEGLPTVATTTLSLGVRNLRRNNVLVRRLSVVETLGALEYVCLDKTGTITHNRMSLVAVYASGHSYRLADGHIYMHRERSDGLTAKEEGMPVGELPPEIFEMLRVAFLCSEVTLDNSNGDYQLQGTPTERALAQAALDAGFDLAGLKSRFPVDRIRLRSEQRNFMDTLHTLSDNGRLLAVKGQPTTVLAMCDRQLIGNEVQPLGEKERNRIILENERMAGRALRVLGVAYGERDGQPELSQDLVWIGLAGIADPPRREIAGLVAQLRSAGIHTTMITGDQSATASAIAREIDLARDGNLQTLDSTRLEELEPDVLRSLAQQIDVFSRVSPAHKLQIVQALQRSGHVVAMTGDGVNDGPALRAADIGIAMGRGSEVAQEVADIVVQDNDLATLIDAIEQGRTTYADIRKAVHFILSSNTSEILITLLTTAAGMGEPLTAMQLLWINLVTDIFPEISLGVEPPELDVMNRPPRDPHAPMFDRGDLRQIGAEGLLLTGAAMSAYLYGLARYGVGPRAGTLAFSTLTAGQLFHAISCRSEPHSIFDPEPFPRNPYLSLSVVGGLALQACAVTLPGLRTFLGATPLGLVDWLVTGGAALTPFVFNETLKVVRRLERERLQEDE